MPEQIYKASAFDNFVSNLPIIMIKAQEELPPDMVRALYKKRDWKPGDGDRATFDSFAMPEYGQRASGELSTGNYLAIQEGDTMTVQQKQYVGKMAYTLRMAKFDKEQLAEQFAKTVIGAINNVLDLEMAHKILSDAEDSTYTPRGSSSGIDWVCADDQPLASATHSLNSGDTFDNTYTAAGSYSTTTITAMMQKGKQQFKNDLGNPVDFEPDTVIHGPDPYMLKKSFEIFGTPKDPGTALNAANIFHTTWNKKIIVLNRAQIDRDGKTYRTSADAAYRYALVDSRYAENWQYQVAGDPMIVLKDHDLDTVLKVIVGASFAAFATVKAQGYMLHYSGVTKPQVSD